MPSEVTGIGNTFPGPGKTLQLLANKHAYAYTGSIASNTTPADVLSFTTANYYFFGELQINIAIQDGAAPTSVCFAEVAFNGLNVARLVAGFSGTDSHPSTTQALVIPPFTEVLVQFYADADESARLATGSITGRIYPGS